MFLSKELLFAEFRPVLESINLIGPQLCQISPGEGASTIEGLVTRDNRRFDAIAEQIQRKAERIHLSKQVMDCCPGNALAANNYSTLVYAVYSVDKSRISVRLSIFLSSCVYLLY